MCLVTTVHVRTGKKALEEGSDSVKDRFSFEPDEVFGVFFQKDQSMGLCPL